MERLIAPDELTEDQSSFPLRPKRLDDFIGQKTIRENLKIFISAAKSRNEAIEHILFYGPPGLGKTTLAHIIAEEMDVNYKSTSGPLLTKPGDLAAILVALQPKDILFIDEIHRLPVNVEEVLYSAMEDFKLDLLIGEGPAARTMEVKINPFTLVGATTKAGALSQPLRDRFGIPMRLEYYADAELMLIAQRAARLLTLQITDEACLEIASRSRGTPRICSRLLRRVRDFHTFEENGSIEKKIVDYTLEKLEIDNIGLDSLDRKYLFYLYNAHLNKPVGIEAIAAALSESRDTIEDIIEPFLIQKSFIQRTPRGRLITTEAVNHIINCKII